MADNVQETVTENAPAGESIPAADGKPATEGKPKRRTRTRKVNASDGAEQAEKPRRTRKAAGTKKAASSAEAASTENPTEAATADSPAKADKPEKAPVAEALVSVPASAPTEAETPRETAAPAGAEGESTDEGQRQRRRKPLGSKQVHAGEGTGSSSQGGKDRQERQERQERADRQDRQRQSKNRNRHDRSNRNREVAPSVTKDDLEAMKVVDLREKAKELEIDTKGMLKADLVQAVYDAEVKKEGFFEVTGILDILTDGYGFLRTEGYLPGEHDVYVGTSMIRRNGLRKGDMITGTTRPARSNEKFGALQRITTVNDMPLEAIGQRPQFRDLTPVYPDERLVMEHGRQSITSRVIDLAAPIGKGQRGLIVSPPKAGKTTVLKQIAASIAVNNPEVHLMCLLVDERPEEVTDMQRSVKGEVISSTFDMPADNHIAVAEMVIERAKRMVEMGADVVILLDSITRLARAYNLAQPASGRILSGGVDSTALYPPKRFLGAARNIEHGGSLTILASALIDTGSKMDEVIFEEFKGTGNMELKLDRNLADRRIYPAIDPVASGTRKEDLLLNPQEAPLIWAVRRILANLNNTERAMDMLIKSLKQTETNQEFLLRTAKKAQGRRTDENFEL